MSVQDPHPDAHPSPSREERLRLELEQLKEKRERILPHAETQLPPLVRPSRITVAALALMAAAGLAAAFVLGYLPRQKRLQQVLAESRSLGSALPVVNVVRSAAAPAEITLELPGSVQAITEAPVLARADGYLKRRTVDIGDRVSAGQVLAEIDAPELEQQVAQARAALEQARAAQQQAAASLEQGRASLELARVTAERWSGLFLKGAVSRQENDQVQAQFRAQTASVQALEKALAAAGRNVVAAEANLRRLESLRDYRIVRAPFAGIITLRNVDTGALISAGQTMLYRIAQVSALRVYINVPQTEAPDVRTGMPAQVSVTELPGHVFAGRIEHTSDALDPSSRTLLADVHVPNPGQKLMPGMYARVRLTVRRSHRPVLIPGDTVVLRSEGPMVAVVRNGRVHYQAISIARDDGHTMEVSAGLAPGELLAVNPGDAVKEGAAVEIRELPSRATGPSAEQPGSRPGRQER